MHDIKQIRKDPQGFDAQLGRRGIEKKADNILSLDNENRELKTQVQTLLAKRNTLSKSISLFKKEGRDVSQIITEVQEFKIQIHHLEEKQEEVQNTLIGILESVPNLASDDVPFGKDENDNKEIEKIGDPKTFDFPAKEHFDVGVSKDLMDFKLGSKLSGSRFVVLKGELAQLERALGQFMLDLHTQEHGYTEMSVPALVKPHTLYGTGQLPKFANDSFHTDDDFWLISTGEIPLTFSMSNEISQATDLPIRLTAITPCFRKEAGAAGKDTRGIIRQHQFSKVELVSITTPDQSEAELERMTQCAQAVLEALGLAYRKVLLCTGDMGFSAQKTYDLEVWLPGQKLYREISSCSNCGAFQARRMKARFKQAGDKETQFLHTLNGSGLAVGRTLVAILENYQNEDGSVTIPEVLQPYLRGKRKIGA